MEEKNASKIVSDHEFLILLKAAKKKDSEAMLQIIELFRGDIENISRMIRIPREDALSHIITELLEFIHSESK